MQERLQKIIARAGLGSRRASEEIIVAGRVRVNGKAIAEPYTAATTDRAEPSVTLKAGQIYVLGDNRLVGESVDSRYYGPVELSDVAGPVSWHMGVGRSGPDQGRADQTSP